MRKCDELLQPDPAKGVAYNGEVVLDIAAKDEKCTAHMSVLVDWFGP
ncbi:hypothetical protein [uncultured Reyranella sp.]|nr:hypothetical protein [uncultured Reyranella sp.]